MPDHPEGQDSYLLVFTNASAAPCTLRDFPGASGINTSGQVVLDAQRNPSGVTRKIIVLSAHGGRAEALLNWQVDGRVGSAKCSDVTPGVAVTTPNTTATHRFAKPVGLCHLAVHPVFAA